MQIWVVLKQIVDQHSIPDVLISSGVTKFEPQGRVSSY